MSFRKESPILKKNTRFEGEVEAYMREEGASEKLARALVARDLLIKRAGTRAKRDKELAFQDPLTGLPNRRFLLGDENTQPPYQGELPRCFAEASRYGGALTLAIIDVDDFKKYNDEFGHPAADKVLKVFGEILRGTLRESDIPARYGGEEFVVIFPQTGEEEAGRAMERLRQRLEEAAGRFKRPVTVSIGIAVFPAPEIADAQDLLKAADQALLRAKEEGKDRIVTW